jgi:hypothetical protein
MDKLALCPLSVAGCLVFIKGVTKKLIEQLTVDDRRFDKANGQLTVGRRTSQATDSFPRHRRHTLSQSRLAHVVSGTFGV